MPPRKLTAQLRTQYQAAIVLKINRLRNRSGNATKEIEQIAQQIERTAFDKISSYKEIALYHQSIADQMFELRYKSGAPHSSSKQEEDGESLHQPVPPFVNPLETAPENSVEQAINTVQPAKPSNRRSKLSKERVATIMAVNARDVKDLVTCANCGPRGKVRYNTKQTCGADEQQTLFCHCENCTSKWKVSR